MRRIMWPAWEARVYNGANCGVFHAAFLFCHDREPDPDNRTGLVGAGGSSVSVRGCGQARRFARSHRSPRKVQQ
jgi:hypothetical protein